MTPIGIWSRTRRHTETVGFLSESDLVFGAIGKAADDDARQAVFAFEAREVPRERRHIEE
jgi:hypothetical protein